VLGVVVTKRIPFASDRSRDPNPLRAMRRRIGYAVPPGTRRCGEYPSLFLVLRELPYLPAQISEDPPN
jgi:hypothetical protein